MRKHKSVPSNAKRRNKLVAMSDEQIDYSDIPELDEAFWKSAEVVTPVAPTEKQISSSDSRDDDENRSL